MKTPNDRYCVVEERRYHGLGIGAEAFHASQSSYQSAKYTHAPVSTRLTGIVDADGRPLDDIVQQFDYDACGRVVAETDALGNITQMQYDALGRVVKEIYPEVDGVAHSKTTRYDDAKNVIVVTDENGVKTRYEYPPLGQMRRVVLAVSNTPSADDVVQSEYTYDASERVSSETAYGEGPDGSITPRAVTAFVYDSFDRVLEKTTHLPGTDAGNIPGESVLYREAHVYNDVLVVPAMAGSRKISAYHKTVRGDGPVSGAPDVRSSTYADQQGRTLWEELAGDLIARYEYDKLGNKLAQTDARGNTTCYTYDYAGRQLSSSYTVSGKRYQNRTRYDELGNKVESWDYAGHKTTFTYAAAGRLLRQQSPFDERMAETKYGYDANGNLIMQAVWQGTYWRETAYAYDARGRQTRATLYQNDEGTQYCRSEYRYDGVGNKLEMRTGITQSVDDYAAVRYSYDRFGNVLSVTDALGQTERYCYNGLGRLLQKTDRNGAVTTYTYDALDRLVEETVTVDTHRGALSTRRTTAYYLNGQKKSEAVTEGYEGAAAGTLVVEYAYNPKGQLVSQREYAEEEGPRAGTQKTMEYDEGGNRRQFILARRGRIEIELWYTYDEANRLSALYKGGPEGEVLAEYAYDANGNRIRLRYPQNGAEMCYGYNHANLVVSLENKLGHAGLGSYTYTYSPDGNQLSKKSGARTVAYEYDRLGRLVREDDEGWNTITYTYDRFSNRAQMVVLGHNVPGGSTDDYTTSYEYDQNNRLLVETEDDRAEQATEAYHYSYDANGAQLRRTWQRTGTKMPATPRGRIGFVKGDEPKGAVTLDLRSYNGFGQLVAVSRDAMRCEYRYRPDGLRYNKTVWNSLKKNKQATIFQWDGQNIVLEEKRADSAGEGALPAGNQPCVPGHRPLAAVLLLQRARGCDAAGGHPCQQDTAV